MRSWRATGQYGYWVIREKDPEGTGSIGEAIRLSAGNKKAAFDIAAALTEAYQSGRDDHATEALAEALEKSGQKQRTAARTGYPALGEDLKDLPPGEHRVRNEDGVLHLASPSAAVLFVVGTRVNVYSDRHPFWRGTITRNNMVAAHNGRLLGWYVVTDDATGQEWEVLPANLMPEERP